MRVIAVNGSPRKTWNTATLLGKALDGAGEAGADTELVHLYDLDYRGCLSCFACKLVGGPSEGRCAVRDGLSPLLDTINTEADALILGTPIYFGALTGEMQSFLERLCFAPMAYKPPPRSSFPRQIKIAMVFTMNATEAEAEERGYSALTRSVQGYLSTGLGPAETLCSYDTYQFPDYSKVVMEVMDPAHKAERREAEFPEDCRRAYELGRRVAAG